ncbi:LysR substrate-binding domain-containing protein [Massilia putida]|uniref:LysR substrate-binding domain-containing protein n=1 Tax=Massilia putida TaxID=1141883 RepID=UPI002277367F|nr:LysR substrate-binding domain-containing protein [Massilia putida]
MHRVRADWRFAQHGETRVGRGRPGMVLNNGDMMRDAAIAGLGIALLPVFIVGAAIKARTLRVIDVGIEAEQEYIYIAHADGQSVREAARPAYMVEGGVRRSALLRDRVQR